MIDRQKPKILLLHFKNMDFINVSMELEALIKQLSGQIQPRHEQIITQTNKHTF